VPAFGLKNKHIQTLFPALFRKQVEPTVHIEKFELKDKDFVECYWSSKPTDKKPIVVLFHGLTGSFQSSYIQGAMSALSKNGFHVVLMHFRGCSGKENRLPRSYHSGETGDAKEFLDYLNKKYPNNQIFAVGYSLGGNMLLKLLAENGRDLNIKAAISVSAPLQLDISANRMNQGFSRLYQYRLMKDLKTTLLNKYKKHDMKNLIGLDEEKVKKLKSFWEFDEAYTAPIHGFKSAQDYYTKSSAKQYLKDIKTDTLLIQALDDPFMTPSVLPQKEELSEKTNISLYKHGGHVGFVSGTILNPQYWLEQKIVSYFTNFK
jgi:hypothetical protein